MLFFQVFQPLLPPLALLLCSQSWGPYGFSPQRSRIREQNPSMLSSEYWNLLLCQTEDEQRWARQRWDCLLAHAYWIYNNKMWKSAGLLGLPCAASSCPFSPPTSVSSCFPPLISRWACYIPLHACISTSLSETTFGRPLVSMAASSWAMQH